MPRIIYSQLVENLVPANTTTGQQFYFQDQPQLRGKTVTGLEIYNSFDITTSPLTPGASVIPAATMSISFLTLHIADPINGQSIGEQINKIPFPTLHRTQLNTTATASTYVQTLIEFNYIVQWDKSYITVSSPGITTTTNPLSYLLMVYYK